MLNIENIYNNSIEKAEIFYDFLDNNTDFSPFVNYHIHLEVLN